MPQSGEHVILKSVSYVPLLVAFYGCRMRGYIMGDEPRSLNQFGPTCGHCMASAC